jgi:pseudaminic acid synthase
MKCHNSTKITIEGRNIGPDFPPYVIAEISGNHNGNIKNAIDLITIAKESGADAVKIQTYTPDTITMKSDREEFKIKGGLWDGYTLYDLYKKAHTPWSWHEVLFKYARKINITLFSSFSDDTAVDFLESLDCPAYKIGSSEIVDLPLIKKAASTGKPLLISTGMSSKEEIYEALEAANSQGCEDIILLHCTSSYPSTCKEANLKRITELKKMHNGVVGLSDHTLDNITSIVSIPFGSSVVEKHIVISKDKETVDSGFSIDSTQLKILVNDVNNAWNSIGSSDFKLTKGEQRSYKYRPSIYVIRDIHKGDLITSDCIRVIRPGFGIKPKFYDSVLNMKVNVDIVSGTPLSWDMIS